MFAVTVGHRGSAIGLWRRSAACGGAPRHVGSGFWADTEGGDLNRSEPFASGFAGLGRSRDNPGARLPPPGKKSQNSPVRPMRDEPFTVTTNGLIESTAPGWPSVAARGRCNPYGTTNPMVAPASPPITTSEK